MANRETCELYIEQEIKSGLERGRKPYQIGKELAVWIEKVFEVNIQPRTIEQRARRLEAEDATNVAKESNTETNTITYKPEEKSVTHPPTDRGGARKGAGRPAQITSSAKPEPIKNRHRRLSAPLDPADKLRMQNENIYEESFKKAFIEFYQEVQDAKLGKWEKTTKEAALYHAGLIIDLITI